MVAKKKIKKHPNEKDIDWVMLDKLCQYKMYLVDCSELLGVSEDTIERRIRKEYNCTFAEYRNKKMARTRMFIVQHALELMKKGNTAITIFMLKNFCGFSDSPNEENTYADEVSIIEPF